MKRSHSRARALPSVPRTLPTLLGPAPVTRVPDLRDANGRACFGIFRFAARDIRLERDMTDLKAWQTYWHEWAHVVIDDAGIRVGSKKLEALCDAFANARVREMLDAKPRRK